MSSARILGKTCDVNFFSTTSHTNGSYTLKCNLSIDVSDNRIYTPVSLDAGFVFDGGNHTITIKAKDIDQTLPFKGLFDIINGTVKNLNVEVCHVNLEDNAGWIDVSHAAPTINSCNIINCTSNGPINGQSNFATGGIAGAYVGYQGLCLIKHCITWGTIGSETITGGYGSGGIVGGNAGREGVIRIEDCLSYGQINNNSGGISASSFAWGNNTLPAVNRGEIINCASKGRIAGINASGISGCTPGGNHGIAMIINCTSSGNIDGIGDDNGNTASGITGNGAGSQGSCFTINCSSSGDINGAHAGGILAGYCGGTNTGLSDAINCTSSGNLNGDYTGGIAGFPQAIAGGVSLITNCTSTGDINGTNSGGIMAGGSFTYNTGTVNISHCMSTSSNASIDYSSGRILGANDFQTINIDECYYYADFSDKLVGSPSSYYNPVDNHPSLSIAGIKLFDDKDNIKSYEYDGVQAMGIDDTVFTNFDVEIKPIGFCKNNIHPLHHVSCTSPSQRQVSSHANQSWNNIYFKFTTYGEPSGKTVRFWIPNSSNMPCTTVSYGVFEGKCKQIGCLTLVNHQYIQDINDNIINASNFWEFTFPTCNKCNGLAFHEHEYIIMATGSRSKINPPVPTTTILDEPTTTILDEPTTTILDEPTTTILDEPTTTYNG